ncbi:spore coat protein GerQ [Alkalibacillus haloalkaliphilus]|uniref:spore coat protein GerQ n=1 Tax=Alkalibacillus haloalkaliphilus TaxID=94136 RepID=UPI003F7B6FF8
MDQSNNNQGRHQNEANRSKTPKQPKGDAHKQPAKKPYHPKDSKQGWYPDKKHPGDKKGNQPKYGDKMPPKYGQSPKAPGIGFDKKGPDYKPTGNKPWGGQQGQSGGMPPYGGGMQQPGGMGPGMQQPGGQWQSPGMQQPGGQWQGPGMQQPGGQWQGPGMQQPGGQWQGPGMQQPGGQWQGPGMQQPGGQPRPPWMQNGQQPMQPQQPTQPQPGIPRERSFIENILRLNEGKQATFYMTFENNDEWNAMIFEGIVREAGKDHIVVEDPESGNWYLLLMIYLDYVQFYEEINYEYPFA